MYEVGTFILNSGFDICHVCHLRNKKSLRNFQGLKIGETKEPSVGESRLSCDSFYSNSRLSRVLNCWNTFFIPLVALEKDIFKLTKKCLMSEKIEPKWACCNSSRITVCGANLKGRIQLEKMTYGFTWLAAFDGDKPNRIWSRRFKIDF